MDERHHGYVLRHRLHVLHPGEVSWYLNEEEKMIEVATQSYFGEVRLRGSTLDLEAIDSYSLLRIGTDSLGPPFWPNVLERKTFEYRISEDGSRLRISTRAFHDSLGILLEKIYVFRAASPR